MLKLPDGMGVATFVKHEGQPPAPAGSQKIPQKSSLGQLRDAYLEAGP